MKPTLAISMGDPGGIGPEVIVKALADRDLRDRAYARVYGHETSLRRAAERAGIRPFWRRLDDASRAGPSDAVVVVDPDPDPGRADAWPARDTAEGGAASFRYVESAIADVRRERGDPLRAHAIVTGPISKRAWELAGHAGFPGHTELLADRFGAPRAGMLFHVRAEGGRPAFNVILATVHVPLMSVGGRLSADRVFETIVLGHDACVELGVRAPRIGVAGLNPHAGESGLMGDEESRVIAPAIRRARDSGLDCHGPFPGDTVFNTLVSGNLDLVVAMYHDQGLIPVKLLARERAVNVTVGLSCVRTSPDHGTAFDIAGQNRADPGSMRSAMGLAVEMAVRRETRGPEKRSID